MGQEPNFGTLMLPILLLSRPAGRAKLALMRQQLGIVLLLNLNHLKVVLQSRQTSLKPAIAPCSIYKRSCKSIAVGCLPEWPDAACICSCWARISWASGGSDVGGGAIVSLRSGYPRPLTVIWQWNMLCKLVQ